MNPTFTFFSDPGHGWLQVPVDFLKFVGLKIDDFTDYSYRSGGNVYLEEDCDASLFLKACKASNIKPVIVESFRDYDSFVRSLPSIR